MHVYVCVCIGVYIYTQVLRIRVYKCVCVLHVQPCLYFGSQKIKNREGIGMKSYKKNAISKCTYT